MRTRLITLVFLAVLSVAVSANSTGPKPNSARFEEGSSAAGLAQFTLVSGSPAKEFILESMTGGVALLDFDGDGLLDIYFVNGNTIDELRQGGRSVSNALFRNMGNGTFRDVTQKAGVAGGQWDMGAYAADIDNDGDQDLLVTGFGGNILYRNNGDGTFTDRTEEFGLVTDGWSAGAAFGDYDGDGWLDLAIVRYVVFDPDNPPPRTPLCTYRGIDIHCGPRGLPGTVDLLYRNAGNGKFKDVSEESGIRTGLAYYGLGVAWSDYDNDGDADLFVANDTSPNFLFNNDNGKFNEIAMMAGVALNEDGNEQAGMGVTFGDVDADGWMDLVQTNFSDDKNTLYENDSGFFNDASYRWGIAEVSWQYLSWGAFFFDADLDGWLDLFIANGHVYPQVDKYQIGTSYRQRDFLFLNQEGKTLRECGEEAGFSKVQSSRGAAVGDLDNDGRLDILVTHLDTSPSLYWNRTPLSDRHWIGFDLRGSRDNRDAVGTRVYITAQRHQQMGEVSAGSSYLSSNDKRLVFGLGDREIEKIEILWPDGTRSELKNWELDSYNRVVQ